MSALEVERVLLVDDDEIGSIPIVAILEEHGVEVEVVTDARHVPALLTEGPLPDLIISDVMMPHLDGFGLCELVRGDRQWRHLPLLFLTARTDVEARVSALDAGGDDILTKPVDHAELLARVRSLGRLRRYRTMVEHLEQLNELVDLSMDGVLILTGEGAIEQSNEASVRLLDLPDEQPAGWRLSRHLHAQFAISGDLDDSALLERSSRSGGRLFVRWQARRVSAPHAAPTTVVSLRDVTESVTRTRAATALLNAVSHEFRTPLTAVLAGAELLEASQNLTADEREIVGLVAGGSHRLRRAVDRMIEFVEAGSASEPDPTRIDEATFAGMLAKIVGADVVLEGLDVPAPVTVDGRIMRLGLCELAANARAAGARAIRLAVEHGRNGVVFSMIDDGEGFPPDQAVRIFEPFHQVDRTGEHDGMGLGLPLVEFSVTQGGGDCGASSTLGGPTRVWISLPSLPGPEDPMSAGS